MQMLCLHIFPETSPYMEVLLVRLLRLEAYSRDEAPCRVVGSYPIQPSTAALTCWSHLPHIVPLPKADALQNQPRSLIPGGRMEGYHTLKQSLVFVLKTLST